MSHLGAKSCEELRFLIIEDDPRWQHLVKLHLESIGGKVKVTIASTREEALGYIENRSYDLATIDLKLSGDAADFRPDDLLHLELLEKIRNSKWNRHAAILVLTGYPSTERTVEAVGRHGASNLIEKRQFDRNSFLEKVRAALREARFRRADSDADESYRLTISFDQGSWLGCQLQGRPPYHAGRPALLETAKLARQGNDLILRVRAEIGRPTEGNWRATARDIGQELYRSLTEDSNIADHHSQLRALQDPQNPMWLRFSGPSAGLGVPFELLHDGGDFLCYRHVLIRQLGHPQLPLARKSEPFHRFLREKQKGKTGEALRILLVGADADGGLLAVEQEIKAIATLLTEEKQRLGLRLEVETLVGDDARYDNLQEVLSEGGYHLLHYAGHGRYDDDLPESSGLTPFQSGDRRTLSAAQLKMLAERSELRFVFLSSCLGARTSAVAGRGDFHGTLEALARADVPEVLAYRWTVRDDPARDLAEAFYRQLWCTLSPGRALLEARREVAMKRGRDVETWASPVLLSQNS